MQESEAKAHVQGYGGRGGKPEAFPCISSDKMAYGTIHVSKCSINVDNCSKICSQQKEISLQIILSAISEFVFL